MDVQQLAEGFWRWTAPHSDWVPGKTWGEMVACLYLERETEAIVLIDPLAPPPGTDDAEKFWGALDRDVTRSGLPVVVLIANAHHGRSAREVYQRYAGRTGAEVHVLAGARDRVSCRPTHVFSAGDPLPAGIGAHSVEGLDGDEVAFHIPGHRALAIADAVLGAGAGRVRVAPESWTDETEQGRRVYRERFRPSLRALLDLDFDLLLPSHGEPVLTGGKAALAEALEAPAWTEG